MDILETIAKMRIERGWTEYQLSQNSGLPQSTISSWYRKNMQPSISSLEHICDAFNITLSQFFAQDSSESKNLISITKKQNELLKEFSKLSQKQQEAFLSLLKTII